MLRTKIKCENQQRAITHKIWWAEFWFLCTALLLNKINPPMRFQGDTLYTFWVMLRTKIKYENQQRAITPKIWWAELWYLCTALLLNEIYPPMRLQDDTWNAFRVILQTKIKYENQQRAITPKIWWAELWFLFTALLLNEIYDYVVSRWYLKYFLSYAPDKNVVYGPTNKYKAIYPRFFEGGGIINHKYFLFFCDFHLISSLRAQIAQSELFWSLGVRLSSFRPFTFPCYTPSSTNINQSKPNLVKIHMTIGWVRLWV